LEGIIAPKGNISDDNKKKIERRASPLWGIKRNVHDRVLTIVFETHHGSQLF
jgi:hypothetical protein